MTYTKSERPKMNRLFLHLQKIDHWIYGRDGGFGWDEIVDKNYKPIEQSTYWILDYLAGEISSAHIMKALHDSTTPYEVAGRAKITKQMVEKKRLKAKRSSPKPAEIIPTADAVEVS